MTGWLQTGLRNQMKLVCGALTASPEDFCSDYIQLHF
jgi:hypothetical protein